MPRNNKEQSQQPSKENAPKKEDNHISDAHDHGEDSEQATRKKENGRKKTQHDSASAGENQDTTKKRKKYKSKRTVVDSSDELPSADNLMPIPALCDEDEDDEDDKDPMLDPTLKLLTTKHTKKRRKIAEDLNPNPIPPPVQPETNVENQYSSSLSSVPDSVEEPPAIPEKKSTRRATRSAKEKHEKNLDQVEKNDDDEASAADSYEDEGVEGEEGEEASASEHSEKPADQIDYQLDDILINSQNRMLLASNQHFTSALRIKLINLTRREILASWLSFTQLNELVKIFGFKYKRGRFTTTEKEQIEKMFKSFCKEKSITASNFVSLSRTQARRGGEMGRGGLSTCSLISRISRKLEGRPNISIWQFMKRAYNPQSKQGPWTEEEEDSLQHGVRKYGNQWTKISELVGRSADDCRDRWRNYTMVKGSRNSGGWSKEEEDQLIELMSKADAMDLVSGKTQDGPWTWVSEQMGGTRSRAQCRIKWTENLKPRLDSENPWSNRDVLILAQKLQKHNLEEDEVGFDWRQVRFGKWGAAHLQKRWKQIKKFVIKKNRSSDDTLSNQLMSNAQVLEQVLRRWGNKSDDFLDSKVRFAQSTWNG